MCSAPAVMNTLLSSKWFILTLLCIHLDGCESHEFGDAEFFKMSGTMVPFDEAEKRCEERGATLPEIYDEDEWEACQTSSKGQMTSPLVTLISNDSR